MADKAPNSHHTAMILGAAGAMLMVLTFALDFLGLGTRRGIGTGQQILLVTSLILLGLGFASRWARPRRWLRSGGRVLASSYLMAAFSVFNVVLLILGVELAGTLIDRHAPIPEVETRGTYYASQPWAQQHWQEFEQARPHFVYSPYMMWHTRPFRGETLQVDTRGVRRTVAAPPTTAASDPDSDYLVLTFGGSAMWGHGAPDDATIPAYLMTELSHDLGRQVRVENLGERGHVATQSLIRLILELQSGNIPDRVIFHHGFNDVAVAITGEPGGHFGVPRVAELLEEPLVPAIGRLRVLSLLRPLISRTADIQSDHGAPDESAQRQAEADMLERATAIVDNYLGTYRLLAGLAREYDFDFYCFWQPVRGVGRAGAVPGPIAMDVSRSAVLDRFLVATYHEIEQRIPLYDNLHSLGRLLDPADEEVWADSVHLTPRGNRLVATAMLQAMTRSAANSELAGPN